MGQLAYRAMYKPRSNAHVVIKSSTYRGRTDKVTKLSFAWHQNRDGMYWMFVCCIRKLKHAHSEHVIVKCRKLNYCWSVSNVGLTTDSHRNRNRKRIRHRSRFCEYSQREMKSHVVEELFRRMRWQLNTMTSYWAVQWQTSSRQQRFRDESRHYVLVMNNFDINT